MVEGLTTVVFTHVLAPAGSPRVLGWMGVAVALHLVAQLCRGLAWHGALAAVCPTVTRRQACAWHVAGAGLAGVLSARGGDAVRVALARRELPAVGCPALAGALAVETSSEALFGLAVTATAVSSVSGAAASPSSTVVVLACTAILLACAVTWRSARLRTLACRFADGMVVLRQPGRFTRTVLPYQVVGRAARLGSLACFLVAFELPAALGVVLAVSAAQGSGRLLPVPGVGTAAAAAALLLVIPRVSGHPVDEASVVALAVIQPTLLTMVGLLVSGVLLSSRRRPLSPRGLLRGARTLRPRLAVT